MNSKQNKAVVFKMETYESVLLVKPEVCVFKIPPRATNRGYRAADWNLQEPQWTGRMRLVAKGAECMIKLEDKNSGELFAKCPIEAYPGLAVESVTDSSRYFVLRIQGDNGRTAFIGLGFQDRSDSFDLNVALQDHFKWLKKSAEIEKEKEEPKQELDLRFKEGETIKINMKITKKDGSEGSNKGKGRPSSGGILPPPPGGVKIAPPPAGTGKITPVHSPVHQPAASSAGSDLLGMSTAGASSNPFSQSTPAAQPSTTSPTNTNWVQF